MSNTFYDYRCTKCNRTVRMWDYLAQPKCCSEVKVFSDEDWQLLEKYLPPDLKGKIQRPTTYKHNVACVLLGLGAVVGGFETVKYY